MLAMAIIYRHHNPEIIIYLLYIAKIPQKNNLKAAWIFDLLCTDWCTVCWEFVSRKLRPHEFDIWAHFCDIPVSVEAGNRGPQIKLKKDKWNLEILKSPVPAWLSELTWLNLVVSPVTTLFKLLNLHPYLLFLFPERFNGKSPGLKSLILSCKLLLKMKSYFRQTSWTKGDDACSCSPW